MHGIVGCWLGPQGASITFQPVQNDEKKIQICLHLAYRTLVKMSMWQCSSDSVHFGYRMTFPIKKQ